MATASKTDIKDRIANNKLLQQILIDIVDSYIDNIDGPLDFENEAIVQIDGTTEFGIKNDGRVYGKSLHNQGDVAGTTDQYIASGTYTPSIVAVSNIDSVTPLQGQWIRVGNVVNVSGSLNVDATAGSTSTQFRVSLPIGSNFSSIVNCGGNGTSYNSLHYMSIVADSSNNDALFQSANMNTSDTSYSFNFTYLIL